MNNYHHSLFPEEKSPALIFLMLFACMAAGFFIAAFFASITVFPFTGEITEPAEIINNPIPENWWPSMMAQMTVQFTVFILTPIVFIKYVLKTNLGLLFSDFHKFPTALGLTIASTFFFMVVNTILIKWNSNLVLPSFLSDLEQYIRSEEDRIARLTDYLTNFTSTDKYFFTLLGVAIIPAIGEELLFRGILQTAAEKYIKNPHVAIILTAILFSAFHIQFYGFLPRMALGALFGYLFYYSGNLIYPMVAHFINNGLTITFIFLFNIQKVDYDIENQESPSILFIVSSFIIGILLMFTYYRLFQKKKLYNG